MLRRTMCFRQVADDGARRQGKNTKGYHLGGRIGHSKVTITRYREQRLATNSDDALISRGTEVKKAAESLKTAVAKMEHPMIWVWYPWRAKPEPPQPSFPCPNALKNLHGAFYGELTPRQQFNHQRLMYSLPVDETAVESKFQGSHPFLAQILKETKGKPKGFPFFFKKYPSRRHANNARFSIPVEMLEGLPAEVQTSLSPVNMSNTEKLKRDMNIYAERYNEHAMEQSSVAALVVRSAILVREMRNESLNNPNNNILKFKLNSQEKTMARRLRQLRKINFRRYWEILRDHDMMDVIQPNNVVDYNKGRYWRQDWEKGQALTTNVADFMDPRGLSGCIETGRSRAEVARDLGLSYTRPLNAVERKALTKDSLYFARLQRFKTESPEVHKARERQRFIAKFTSMFAKTNNKTQFPDFPSTFRMYLGNRILRWTSKRHGPSV